MTLPPSKIGDKGQRYKVEGFNYPIEGQWHALGYVHSKAVAEDMKAAILLAPSCTDARVIDREEKL